MVCMDGFILTHAYERVDVPDQEQVDAFLPPFEPRQVLDPAEPVTIGAMVGPEAFTEVKYLAHAKQMQALDLIPEIAARVRERRSAATPAAWSAATAPRTPRRSSSRSARCSGTIEDVVDELRDDGVQDRRASASSPSGRSRSTRCARRSATRSGWSCSRRRSPSASAGSSRPNVRMALSGIQLARLHRDRRARRPADHQGVAAAAVRATRSRTSSSRSTSSTWTGSSSSASWPRAAGAPPGPARREHAARPRHRRRGLALSEEATMPYQEIKFYQTGTFVVGNRLLDPEQRSRAGPHGPLQHAHLGPPRLPGLRRGARRPLRARRRDARHRRQADRRQRHRLPRGLLDALPGVVLAAAVDPLAVRQRAGGRDRHRRGAEGEGPRRTSGWSARAATAAPSTSASAACRGCSSATTTCSSSATTTRPT